MKYVKYLFLGLLILALVSCSDDDTTTTSTTTDTSGDSVFISTTTSGKTYTIVDTSQSKFYDNSTAITYALTSSNQDFFGQDAQYVGNQPSYTVSGDNYTVLDNQTGLTWMRGPNMDLSAPLASDKMSYTAALTYVTTVNSATYGGYNDWRLPSCKELYSLIQFNGTDGSGLDGTDTSSLTPFIDTSAFNFAYGETAAGERIIDSQYLTSDVYVQDPGDDGYTMHFGVNFADGRIKGYNNTNLQNTEKTFFVQLVRGNTSYGVNSFTDNSDGTITDSATGLMWAKNDSGSAMHWLAALAWVQIKNGENYQGYTNWRMPNAKEMQSILDYSRSPNTTGSAAINAMFNCTSINNEENITDYPWYWTSSTHIGYSGSGDAAAYICFGRAMAYDTDDIEWIDVHGAGCQRSDPKGGDFTDYEQNNNGYYHDGAPQGDAVRISNYVRLVRNAD